MKKIDRPRRVKVNKTDFSKIANASRASVYAWLEKGIIQQEDGGKIALQEGLRAVEAWRKRKISGSVLDDMEFDLSFGISVAERNTGRKAKRSG